MGDNRPQDFGGEFGHEKPGPDGPEKTQAKVSFSTEDIIAVFAGVIALLFAVGMIFGKVPINALTVGVLGFSGVGAAIAKIKGKKGGK